ncbi:SPOR domain-containing protein [Hydrogenophaga sp.]|uniref:SPOR domain-containing protein n=1 Tax=Hydrogenophaga sp. TaxID=1904254 RepID=UPI0025B8B20F|nr:SPOR domain-containing protein [Hydrogenophaga sp.]
MRRRARHRLIGAAVLVLVGVLGFPLLFDTQPRPIAVDIPIEIPSRNPAPSASSAKPAASAASAASDSAMASGGGVSTGESLSAREEEVESKPTVVAKADKAEAAKPDTAKPQPKASEKGAAEAGPAKPAANADEKTSDKADDKPAAGTERIVVQVGAFAEVERAREARLKLERAGLKTYTHVAETSQGKRIRVRMGPFATRAEADKAAARAKALGLPAALLWL